MAFAGYRNGERVLRCMACGRPSGRGNYCVEHVGLEREQEAETQRKIAAAPKLSSSQISALFEG
jgi:hypothetical protein